MVVLEKGLKVVFDIGYSDTLNFSWSKFGFTIKLANEPTIPDIFCFAGMPCTSMFHVPGIPNEALTEYIPRDCLLRSTVIGPIDCSIWVYFSWADAMSMGFPLLSKNDTLKLLFPTSKGVMAKSTLVPLSRNLVASYGTF